LEDLNLGLVLLLSCVLLPHAVHVFVIRYRDSHRPRAVAGVDFSLSLKAGKPAIEGSVSLYGAIKLCDEFFCFSYTCLDFIRVCLPQSSAIEPGFKSPAISYNSR
jgi:hypothetical protein